jgi:hypothetical protein
VPPDTLRRKLGEKPFRRAMVGYLPDALGYRVYSSMTSRITTYEHIIFLESILGFGVSTNIDFMITYASDADSGHDQMP